MQSRDNAQLTSLKLLAPDGIVHVAFARVLSGDEYLAILSASREAPNVDALQLQLRSLGEAWGIATDTTIVSRQKPASSSQRV